MVDLVNQLLDNRCILKLNQSSFKFVLVDNTLNYLLREDPKAILDILKIGPDEIMKWVK